MSKVDISIISNVGYIWRWEDLSDTFFSRGPTKDLLAKIAKQMESMKAYGRITDDGHQAMTITQIELRTRRVDIFFTRDMYIWTKIETFPL